MGQRRTFSKPQPELGRRGEEQILNPGSVPLSLESSLLSSANYHAEEQWLDLEFRNGAVYRYFHVLEHVFQSLQTEESAGGYFNREIRNQFDYRQIRLPD